VIRIILEERVDTRRQAAMEVPWERLIRFVATDGRVLHGEPILPAPDFDLGFTTSATNLKAKIVEGDDLYSAAVCEDIVTVDRLLGPLTPKDVPTLRCVGLNYAKHSKKSSGCPFLHPSSL